MINEKKEFIKKCSGGDLQRAILSKGENRIGVEKLAKNLNKELCHLNEGRKLVVEDIKQYWENYQDRRRSRSSNHILEQRIIDNDLSEDSKSFFEL